MEPANRGLGRCSKDECKMLQKYDSCTSYISAKLLVKSQSIVLSVYAHGQMVRDIAAVDDLEEISEEILLQVPIVRKVKYNQQYTITEIEMQDSLLNLFYAYSYDMTYITSPLQ